MSTKFPVFAWKGKTYGSYQIITETVAENNHYAPSSDAVAKAIKPIKSDLTNLLSGIDVSEEDGDVEVTIKSRNLDITLDSDENLKLLADGELNMQSDYDIDIISKNSDVNIKAGSDVIFEANGVTTNLGDNDISNIGEDGTLTGAVSAINSNLSKHFKIKTVTATTSDLGLINVGLTTSNYLVISATCNGRMCIPYFDNTNNAWYVGVFYANVQPAAGLSVTVNVYYNEL